MHRARPRQPLDRGEGPPGARGRGARAEDAGHCRRSIPAPASSRAAWTTSPRTRSASSSSSSSTGKRATRRMSSWTSIRDATSDLPGILVEVTAPHAGPPTGKPVQVQLSALDPAALPTRRARSPTCCAKRADIRDVDDGLPLPGIDWKLEVDKAEAAKYGASVDTVGTAVQLVTNGVKVTEYRPADSDKSVDILRALPAGPAQPRRARRAARADRRRAMCRSAISSSACRRRASATSTASTATA